MVLSMARGVAKKVIDIFNDKVLEDKSRLKVATRLLEDRAKVWWESLKGRSYTRWTCLEIQREFNEQYYT